MHLPPPPPQERKVELQQIFNQLRRFLHLPPPPPPQETVEEQAGQEGLIETPVEVDQVGFEEQVVVDVNIEQVPDDDDIEIVAEFPAPERRHRNARRVTDDDEYVVESGVATTTMKIAGNTVMKKE